MIHGKRVAVVLLVRDARSSVPTLVSALPNDVVDDVLVVGGAASDDAVRLIQAYGLRPRLRVCAPGAGGNPAPRPTELLALDAEIVVLIEPDDQDDPRLVSAMASMVASGACDIVVERRAAAAADPGSSEPSGPSGPTGHRDAARWSRLVRRLQRWLSPGRGIPESTGYRACSRSVLEALGQEDGPVPMLLDAAAIARAARLGFTVGTIVHPTGSGAGRLSLPAPVAPDQWIHTSAGQPSPRAGLQAPRVDPARQPATSRQGDSADSARQPVASRQNDRADQARQPAASRQGDSADSVRQPAASRQGDSADSVRQPAAASNLEPIAAARPPESTVAARRKVTALLAGLILATLLPALFGVAHAVSYARIPTIPVSFVREVRLVAPGVRPMTDLQGLTVTPDGAILVAELGGQRLIEFRDGTSESGVVLAGPDSVQPLRRPFDVALTPDGIVLVLDQATGMVHRVQRDGRRLPPLPLGLPGARALAIDASGTILVADTGAGLVRRYRPDGSPDAGWGERRPVGQTPIGEVVGVVFLDGRVMATSGSERGVTLLDASGQRTGRATTIGNVGPLTRLSDDRLLMTDLPTNRVWVLDTSGQTVGRLVRADGDETLFFQPRGAAAPGDGCLYVASDSRLLVYRFEQPDAVSAQPGAARRC